MIEPFQRRNLFEAQGLCIWHTFFRAARHKMVAEEKSGGQARRGRERGERGDKKEERKREEGKEGKRRVEMYKNNVQKKNSNIILCTNKT